MKQALALLAFSTIAASPAAAQLRGDPEAIAQAEKMIERLGGAEAWSSARTLHLVYDGWDADPGAPMIEEAWRDLTRPWTTVHYTRPDADAPFVEFHQRPDRSWLIVRGEHRPFDEAENAANQSFWRYDFYTVLRRLAADDNAITLAADENRITLTGPEGEDWGWFQIDATGQPVRWGAMDRGEPLEYIYGPVTDFGDIAFPAWATSVDGGWRFSYETVALSADAPPDLG